MTVRFSLTASMLRLALISVVPPLYASGYMASYSTEYGSGYTPEAVYKSVDSAGKVTYSTSWPEDTVAIEEVAIKPGPSEEYAGATRERHEKISETALALTQAREKREADREQDERKRLEKLALKRSARPQVYERTVYVGWNPLWRPHPPVAHYGKHSHKYPSRPVRKPGLSRGIPLRTGTGLR